MASTVGAIGVSVAFPTVGGAFASGLVRGLRDRYIHSYGVVDTRGATALDNAYKVFGVGKAGWGVIKASTTYSVRYTLNGATHVAGRDMNHAFAIPSQVKNINPRHYWIPKRIELFRTAEVGVSFSQGAFALARTGFKKLAGFVGRSMTGMFPQKPGGIRLAGASAALGDLGALAGVAVDETNGRLVLLGSEQRRGDLPPLRLDDIVTIFRCVYLSGEAPSVTIDPISDSKTEKWMKVGHDPGTEFTYVGWVLFEADRVMKCYGLGQDNDTKRKVRSRVPGYRDFNAIGGSSGKQRWERFWIVPASEARVQGATADLTMLECPLELLAERMTWDGKRLVTAKNPKPSPSAAAYTKWFTTQYDRLAKEVRSMPPEGCGIDQPVAVFEELKRIAIITGVAEALRDQNVPMPGWMYDYPVQPCVADPLTPMIHVKGDGYKVSGGVRMTASDAKRTTRTGDAAVTRLSKELKTRLSTKPLFTPVMVTYKGTQVKAVTIPGAETTTSGANVLRHTDLPSEALVDAGFGLTREFNSYYDPQGIFGRGWTLDLPELKKARQPVSRTERTVQYKTVWQLTSPLNAWSERFAVTAMVPERNVEMLTSGRSDTFLGLVQGRSPIDGQETMELALREGGSWHFDLEGHLVARVGEDVMVLYRRNDQHRLESVEFHELRGGRPIGDKPHVVHMLGYDEGDPRVKSIETRASELLDPVKLDFLYGKNGQLGQVMRADLSMGWGYRYSDGLVESVQHANEPVGSYTYDDQGKVIQQALADGRSIGYERSATSYGSKVVARDAETGEVVETVEYDGNSRLIGSSFEDDSRMTWSDTDDGAVTTLTLPDGDEIVTTDSLDGQSSTTRTSSGVEEVREYDSSGRLIRAQIEGGLGMRQSWDSRGRLKSVDYDDQVVKSSYTAQGQLTSLTTTPPEREGQHSGEFVQTSYGLDGRVSSVSDETGALTRIEYEDSGVPAHIQGPRASMDFERDKSGRLRKLETSWGMTEVHDYDPKGDALERITIRQEGAQGAEEARIEFQQGRVTKVRQPDGAETKVEYFQDSKREGLLKSFQNADKLTLSYGYSSGDQLDHIDVTPVGGVGSYRVRYLKDKKGRLTGIRHESLKR
ncbi:MAG: YD repeat-containing protein [Planctomycetota bacterium]|jgi:YD repeat-containing protein